MEDVLGRYARQYKVTPHCDRFSRGWIPLGDAGKKSGGDINGSPKTLRVWPKGSGGEEAPAVSIPSLRPNLPNHRPIVPLEQTVNQELRTATPLAPVQQHHPRQRSALSSIHPHTAKAGQADYLRVNAGNLMI